MHFADACASLWIEGELVPVEDLVLHDEATDVRAPTPQLARAMTVLQARRLVAARQPGWALTRDGGMLLSGESPTIPNSTTATDREHEPNGDDEDTTTGDAGLDAALSLMDMALERSRRVLSAKTAAVPASDPDAAHRLDDGAGRRYIDSVAHLPPLLAAGLLWDRWRENPPVPARAWFGRQMAADYLRARGKAAAHLPAINAGLRTVAWERRRSPDRVVRLLAWLEAAQAGARTALAEHDRLNVAIATLQHRCAARRATSRLADLIAFASERPLVTAATAARALGTTNRAALKLIAELGLHEATGRGRYRAWRL